MENVVLKNANLEVVISTLGAEIISFKKDGVEKIWCGNPDFWSGKAPILFPFAGRLKNGQYEYDGKVYQMNIHGFARKSVFEVSNISENTAQFILNANDSTLSIYPFDFSLKVTYTLTDKLDVKFSVTNNDEKDMFFTIGCHEGYAINSDLSEYFLEFEKEEVFDSLQHNENGLMTDKVIKYGKGKVFALSYDLFPNAWTVIFENTVSKEVTLKHKTKGELVKVSFPSFNNLLLWTTPNSGYLCIEPWSSLPDYQDASGNLKERKGVTVLSSKQIIEYKHTIKI